MSNYMLIDGKVVETSDIMEWAKWYGENRDLCRVDLDEIIGSVIGQPYRVSTVFLALDHNFGGGNPILWETMVFWEGFSDLYCQRYSSLESAKQGHQKAVSMLVRKRFEFEVVSHADEDNAAYNTRKVVYAITVDEAEKIIKSEAIPFGLKSMALVNGHEFPCNETVIQKDK